ncbi:hypothetical protein AB0B48_24470 [Micromonospora sp. NPDC049089]|uniref:hypothetical protein n=1 Tax=Micromonospora sp. NPDC049089 TaxID=3155496 RepID=UPI0033D2DF5E
MRASLISGHVLGSVTGIVLWQVAIHLPTDQPPVELVGAGVVGPPLFAALSLGLIALAGGGRPASESTPVPPVQRRAVASPQQKAVTR